MKIVIDASIILSVILGEDKKQKVISATSGFDLISPLCLPWEIGNALSACLKKNRFNLKEINIAWRAFETIPIKLSNVNVVDSLNIAKKFNLYAYDCYYIQCAMSHNLPLLSLDKKMIDVSQNLNLKIVEV